MTVVAIRKKLAHYMQVANDEKIKAMYTLLKEDIKQEERISIAQYNKELNEAEAEFAKGEFITHDAMLKQIKQW
jgi:hypothetical protein